MTFSRTTFMHALVLCFVLGSCVSKRVYNAANNALLKERHLSDSLLETTNGLSGSMDSISHSHSELSRQHDSLYQRYQDTTSVLNGLLLSASNQIEALETITSRLQADLESGSITLQRFGVKYEALRTHIEGLRQNLKNYQTVLNETFAGVPKGIEIEQYRDRIKLIFPQEILFPEGQAAVPAVIEPLLNQLGSAFSKESVEFAIEGHTDDQPIVDPAIGFDDNWELSFARARNVSIHINKGGVPFDRINIIGKGEYSPIASNNTENGRAQNRRTEVVLFTEDERLQAMIYDEFLGEPTEAKVITEPIDAEKYFLTDAQWIINLNDKSHTEIVAICRKHPEWTINSGNEFFDVSTRLYWIILVDSDDAVKITSFTALKDKEENVVTFK